MKFIIWGYDFLGKKIALWCEKNGIEIEQIWDTAKKNNEDVLEPLNQMANKNTPLCICIGNSNIRKGLAVQARKQGFNPLSEKELQKIYKSAIGNEPVLPVVTDLDKMNLEERLNSAFDYAIESENFMEQHQKYYREKMRLAKHIFYYCGNDYYDQMFWDTFLANNGLKPFAGRLSVTLDQSDCYTVDQLSQFENSFVFFLGDGEIKIKSELKKRHIPYCDVVDFERRVFDPDLSASWFKENRMPALTALNFFKDNASRNLYVNFICNRIAPQYADQNYTQMNSNKAFYWNYFELAEKEALVDCGAFTGDSIKAFLEKVKFKFDHIYAFEMEENVYAILESYIKSLPESIRDKITIYKEGLSNFLGTSYALDNGSGGCVISNSKGTPIVITTLDYILKDKKITWIKMDIEGSEINALSGAKEIITSQKPVITASVYHHLGDIWEIPFLLKSYNSDYKFYLSHHTNTVWDTVLYAH